MKDQHDWNDAACWRRYLALARRAPVLFAAPGGDGAGYEILTDPAMVAQAQAAAAKRRASHECDDLRVGVLGSDPYVLFLRDAVRFPDATLGLYNRIAVPRGIVVAPLIGDRLILLYRFRHGTRQWHYEFPRGIADTGEDIATAVQRELAEEIGAQALELTPLGGLHSCSGVTNEYSDLFLAHVGATGAHDRHEAISRLELVEPDRFRAMVASGTITDAPTLALYARALARGLLP